MKTYNAEFTGRTKNATGIFYPIKTQVVGKDEKDAGLNLYDGYEHIQGLKLTEAETAWQLWECKKGNRFSTPEYNYNEYEDGGFCNFSGCKSNDHKWKLVKRNADRDEASNWFKNIYKESK